MEGEFNFLSFLPRSERIATRDQWYRDVDEARRAQVYGGPATTLDVESSIAYRGGDAKEQFLALLQSRLKPVLDTRLQLAGRVTPELAAPLRELQAIRGAALQWIPEATLLVVEGADGNSSTFSLLRDTGHANVSNLVEGKELRPEENTLTVVPVSSEAIPMPSTAPVPPSSRHLPPRYAGFARSKTTPPSRAAGRCVGTIRRSGRSATSSTPATPGTRAWRRGCSTTAAWRTGDAPALSCRLLASSLECSEISLPIGADLNSRDIRRREVLTRSARPSSVGLESGRSIDKEPSPRILNAEGKATSQRRCLTQAAYEPR